MWNPASRQFVGEANPRRSRAQNYSGQDLHRGVLCQVRQLHLPLGLRDLGSTQVRKRLVNHGSNTTRFAPRLKRTTRRTSSELCGTNAVRSRSCCKVPTWSPTRIRSGEQARVAESTPFCFGWPLPYFLQNLTQEESNRTPVFCAAVSRSVHWI